MIIMSMKQRSWRVVINGRTKIIEEVTRHKLVWGLFTKGELKFQVNF